MVVPCCKTRHPHTCLLIVVYDQSLGIQSVRHGAFFFNVEISVSAVLVWICVLFLCWSHVQKYAHVHSHRQNGIICVIRNVGARVDVCDCGSELITKKYHISSRCGNDEWPAGCTACKLDYVIHWHRQAFKMCEIINTLTNVELHIISIYSRWIEIGNKLFI